MAGGGTAVFQALGIDQATAAAMIAAMGLGPEAGHLDEGGLLEDVHMS